MKLSEFRKLYDEIGDDAIEIIDSLGITSENLNDVIPDYKRRQFKRKIEAWKEDGIVKGYFAYMITSLTRYTYAKVFEILIYGLYLTKNKQINALSNQVFKEAVQDCYDQGKKDLKQPTRKLKWAFILPLLMMPDLNLSYEEYLEALGHTAAQETYRRIIEHIKLKLKVTFDILKDLLRKQINRILNINRDKYSGVIVEVVRGAGNKGYIGADDEKDELIKFIAEMDDRTTRMCTSLDGQIFHTRAWNRFTRYSDYYKGLHTFNCFGLEQGLNLPPINDHFHWCRSTVAYDIYMSSAIAKLIKEVLSYIPDEKAAKVTKDITDVFKRISYIKEKHGYKEDITVKPYVEKNGTKYYIDQERVIFDPTDEEILYALKFQNEFNEKVVMRPRTSASKDNELYGVRSSDYLFGSNTYDLKIINGSGSRTIARNIKDAKRQSDNFIIKLNTGSRTIKDAINDINKVKKNNTWIKTVYLFDETDSFIEKIE